MSEERETELVAGTIGGITQKKADTWTVAVLPDGSQYSKNLWTKDVDLVESLAAKIGQHGAFVCGASYWEKDGKKIRSLWIDALSDGSEAPDSVATPDTAPRAASPQKPAQADGGMSKEEWARKDSAIHKMACIKTAAAVLTHTLPSDPSTDYLNTFLERVFHLSYSWHRNVIAERDDPTGENVPF
jgi:hypothetical protein